MLCLGSIGMDHVITVSCYKGTILQKNYRKMTILWSFSYNSFVKFNGKNIWEPQHDCVITSSYYNQVCYVGAVLYSNVSLTLILDILCTTLCSLIHNLTPMTLVISMN